MAFQAVWRTKTRHDKPNKISNLPCFCCHENCYRFSNLGNFFSSALALADRPLWSPEADPSVTRSPQLPGGELLDGRDKDKDSYPVETFWKLPALSLRSTLFLSGLLGDRPERSQRYTLLISIDAMLLFWFSTNKKARRYKRRALACGLSGTRVQQKRSPVQRLAKHAL
jgi:hypothetical protein